MRRADRKRSPKSVTTPSNGSSVAYKAGQREQLRLGLRILARMIVRAHLRRERRRHQKGRLADEPLMGRRE